MARISVAPRKNARLQAARGHKKTAATTPAQKPRKSLSAKGTPTSKLSNQNRDGFPFLSLSAEIQLYIFNIVFSHLPNYVLRKTAPPFSHPSLIQKRRMMRVRAPHDASQFLLTCRTIHRDFAPLYWQLSTVRFTDPIKLANEFLAFASTTAMANLSHLHYTVNTNGFEEPSWENDNSDHILTIVKQIRKLAEIVSLYRELKGLQSFQVEITLGTTLQGLTRTMANIGFENRVADGVWKSFDANYRGCFEELELRLLRKTLRGFKIDKAMVEDDAAELLNNMPGWREVRPTALRMTFSKREA